MLMSPWYERSFIRSFLSCYIWDMCGWNLYRLLTNHYHFYHIINSNHNSNPISSDKPDITFTISTLILLTFMFLTITPWSLLLLDFTIDQIVGLGCLERRQQIKCCIITIRLALFFNGNLVMHVQTGQTMVLQGQSRTPVGYNCHVHLAQSSSVHLLSAITVAFAACVLLYWVYKDLVWVFFLCRTSLCKWVLIFLITAFHKFCSEGQVTSAPPHHKTIHFN